MHSLLRASHAGPAFAVTGVATALALSVGRGTGALAVGAAVAAGQLAVGWSNDYLDRERDARAGRTDKPIVAGDVAAGVVGGGAVAALVLCIPLSMLSGWRSGLLHLAAVAAAGAYNAGLKGTVVSPLPYLFAFASLPIVVTFGLDGHPLPPWWAVVVAGLMGTGAHFINALPDIYDDLALGVTGLPQRLGPRRSLITGAGLLAAAVVVLTFAPSGAPSGRLRPAAVGMSALAAVLVLGVVLSARSNRARQAWTFTLATAAAAVALFLVNGRSLAPVS